MGPLVIEGRVHVRRLEGRVIEARAEGYLSRRAVTAGLRALDALLAEEPGRFNFLSDGSTIDGFDAGSPILVVRWAATNADRYHRSAIVARQPTLVAVTRTFQYLLPMIPIGVFATRSQALAYLDEPLVPGATRAVVERAATQPSRDNVGFDRSWRRVRPA